MNGNEISINFIPKCNSTLNQNPVITCRMLSPKQEPSSQNECFFMFTASVRKNKMLVDQCYISPHVDVYMRSG